MNLNLFPESQTPKGILRSSNQNLINRKPCSPSQISRHFLSSPPASFLFLALALALAFAPLRSLFFSPDMPFLHASAYLVKKFSISVGSTIVDSLTLSFRFSLDLPFVARIRMGTGEESWRSERSSGCADRPGGLVPVAGDTMLCQQSSGLVFVWYHTSLLGQEDGAFAFFSLGVEERSKMDKELQTIISTIER